MNKKFSEMFTFEKIDNTKIIVTADSVEAMSLFFYWVVLVSFNYVDEKYPDGDIEKMMKDSDVPDDISEIDENEEYYID